MDMIKIGRFIAQRRKDKNLTQSSLAQIMGVTDRSVSKWENGRLLQSDVLESMHYIQSRC